MLLLLVACAPSSDSANELGKPTETGAPIDSAETGESGETGETADTTESGETGDSEPPPEGPWTPPSWMAEATATTVPADRGLAWEEDEDFALDGFSVPLTFVMPDGRYGMLVTDMRGTDTFSSRFLLVSDDGLTWEEEGALLRPEQWGYGCGDKLTHATLWREADGVWTFLAEGGPAGDGFELEAPRYVCAASTTDMESFVYDEAPTFTGTFEDDLISIPAALATPEGDALLWYNGDLQSMTTGGPGIRTVRLSQEDRSYTVLQADPVSDGWEDAYPVYVEGGHVRLYARYSEMGSEETGIAMVELDDTLTPVAGPTRLLPAAGTCGSWPWHGECTGDPTLLHLPDGRLVLYYYRNTFGDDGSFTTSIGRAFATD